IYQGKSLSAWLEQYHDALEDPWSPTTSGTALKGTEEGATAEQAQAAIRAMGTNALPVLVQMAGSCDPIWKRKLAPLYYRHRLLPLSAPAEIRHRMAALGFYALGKEAKPAVPALKGLMEGNEPEVVFTAARALGYIGDAARSTTGSVE